MDNGSSEAEMGQSGAQSFRTVSSSVESFRTISIASGSNMAGSDISWVGEFGVYHLYRPAAKFSAIASLSYNHIDN